MSAISETTGEKARLNLLESLPLINPNAQKPAVPKRASTVQPLGRKASNLQPQMNGKHAAFGSMPPPPSKMKSTPDFSEFKAWAQDAISNQQKDIDRVSGTLLHIEGEMQMFKKFMKEVRTELATGREFHQNQIQDRDGLVKVSGELGQLQTQVNSMDQEFRGKSGGSLSRDIEIIISDMLQVSEKANEVDGLKADVEQLKTNVKGVEDVVQVGQIPSEVDNLRLELQALKSRLESVQEAVNQAPSPPTSTQQASISNRPLSERIQGRSQAGKRLSRVEIHVRPSEQPINPTTNLETPTPAQEDFEDGLPNPSLKRKYGNIEKSSVAPADQETEEPSLPTKRRRVTRKSEIENSSQTVENGSGSSGVRFQSPGPEIIEILSSERGSSPILGEHTETGGINSATDNPQVDKQPHSKATPDDATNSASNAPRGRPRRESLRKTASMNNLATPSTVPLQDPAALEMANSRRQSRDSRGVLITSSGKVDGRSLRRSRVSHSNKENETPVQTDQDTDNGADQQPSERIQKANPESARGLRRTRSNPKLQSAGLKKDRAGGEPSQDAILPSIERDELDEIQVTNTDAPAANIEKASEAQTVEPESSTPTTAKPASEKPFKCESCGKGYTSLPWLNKVSISPLPL